MVCELREGAVRIRNSGERGGGVTSPFLISCCSVLRNAEKDCTKVKEQMSCWENEPSSPRSTLSESKSHVMPRESSAKHKAGVTVAALDS